MKRTPVERDSRFPPDQGPGKSPHMDFRTTFQTIPLFVFFSILAQKARAFPSVKPKSGDLTCLQCHGNESTPKTTVPSGTELEIKTDSPTPSGFKCFTAGSSRSFTVTGRRASIHGYLIFRSNAKNRRRSVLNPIRGDSPVFERRSRIYGASRPRRPARRNSPRLRPRADPRLAPYERNEARSSCNWYDPSLHPD